MLKAISDSAIMFSSPDLSAHLAVHQSNHMVCVQFTMPVEVNWQFMNKGLMSRFWQHRGPLDHADKASMADRILVFHRGITSVCPPCTLCLSVSFKWGRCRGSGVYASTWRP